MIIRITLFVENILEFREISRVYNCVLEKKLILKALFEDMAVMLLNMRAGQRLMLTLFNTYIVYLIKTLLQTPMLQSTWQILLQIKDLMILPVITVILTL